MAQFDRHRFAYYRYIKDHNLYPEFKRWLNEKGLIHPDVQRMSLFLVHKGLRNDMIGNSRYDRDAAANVALREKGLTPFFDMSDEEYRNIALTKWIEKNEWFEM